MLGNRPEARPLTLDVLDYYQVQAIERMSETLLNALQALKHIPRAQESKSSTLDHFRASNNFFLSGEAGSGKTTAYLSLREALKSDNPCSDANRPKLTQFFRLKDKLKDKAKRLVWLEPLDLESAPEFGNFLAAVLVRIEEKIEKDPRTEKHRRGILDSDTSDALQEYERLQNDVVLAWEGNIPQRAEHLDPDVYALEVLNAAKASTKVKPRLQRALEDLFAEEGREQQRLFVLPIDDFYLHPSSSLKLLRLLRMISVPQLFSLVMGDLYTLEELIYQDTLGKLVALAGEQALGRDAQNRQWKTLSSVATVLSADSLRKLVPMGQRYHLAVMHQLGALGFFPQRLDPPGFREASPHQYRYTLKDFLGLLPVEIPLAAPIVCSETKLKIRSLLSFLRLRSTVDEGKNDDYYTYSGLTVLDLPPREVVDLWYCMKNQLPALPPEMAHVRVRDKEANEGRSEEEEREIEIDRLREKLKRESKEDAGWDATLKLVADATREAIFGQTYISKEDQDTCAEAVKGPRGYSKKAFASGFLRAEPDLIPMLRIPLERGIHVGVYKHQGWFFWPNRPGLQKTDNLAPRPTAWLTVLHDLMSLSGEDRLAGEPLTPDRFSLRLVEVVSGSGSARWPTPRWVSFWHFDRLGFAWRRVVNEARELRRQLSPEDLLAWLAFHWIRHINNILLSNLQEIEVAPQRGIEEQWEKLVGDTVALLDFSRSKEKMEPEAREMVHDWLIDLAAMLLLKEFAVPESVWDRFHHSPLHEFWQNEGQSISIARKAAREKTDSKSEHGAP